MRLARLLTFVVLFSLAVIACAPGSLPFMATPTPTLTPTPTCDLKAYQDGMEPIMDEWRDAISVAEQTPRIQLSGRVADLQALRRRAEAVEATCKAIEDAQTLGVFAMQKQIDGFLSFMAEESDSQVSNHFDTAQEYWDKYNAALAKIN